MRRTLFLLSLGALAVAIPVLGAYAAGGSGSRFWGPLIFGWVVLSAPSLLILYGLRAYLEQRDLVYRGRGQVPLPAPVAGFRPVPLAEEREGRCPLCHEDFGGEDACVRCEDCETLFHRGCVHEIGSCSTTSKRHVAPGWRWRSHTDRA